jgi:hypothetical protein
MSIWLCFKPSWKDVRSTLIPPIKDDELGLVIPADPKTPYVNGTVGAVGNSNSIENSMNVRPRYVA